MFDLYEYLLRQRIIMVGEYINDKVATKIVASLMALEQVDENAEIRLYLNTPGGQPYSVFGVADAIKSVKPPVSTVGLGTAYSYSSILLGAGTKGRRFATKNCRIMMTMPMGGSEGSHFAIERTVQELNALYQMQLCYFKNFTDLSWQQLEDLTVRDTFLTPEEAVDIGLVDKIISGPNDYFVPPAKARQQVLAGIDPPYNPGIGSAGIKGWTGRMG